MTIKRFSRALGIAAGLAVMTLSPTFAVAQAQPATAARAGEQARPDQGPPPRIAGDRNDRRRQRERQQNAAAADPAVVKAEVEALLTASATPCQATDTKLLGASAEKVKIYETACATGPGYILVASTPPQVVDCVILDSQAQTARAANPEAATGPTCSLPGNQDIQGFLKAYATEAGVACTVDEAKVRGRSSEGTVIYEIGCAGADGYWIEKKAAGWEKIECLQIISQNSTCPFTTPAEQAATVKSWLTGSDAANCDVQQVRLMGQNANGRFVEVTCAGAEGSIVRFNAEHAVQQVYPCATAERIGGGCKLTTAAPAATPQA